MNFRELILERILTLLRDRLKIEDAQTRAGEEGILFLIPNDEYDTAFLEVLLGPVEQVPAQNPPPIPCVYVSFGGGEVDLTADALLNNVIENLSILITLFLSTKIGIEDGGKVRAMELQASDALHDIQTLVNLNSLASAVHVSEDAIAVRQVVLERWEFVDDRRGGEIEVLNLTFTAQIEKIRNP